MTKIIKKEFGNPEINKIIGSFQTQFDLNLLDGSIAENRRYANLLLKKCQNIEVALMVISLASSDEFYGDKLTSLKRLYYHMVEIVQKARKKQTKSIRIR